LSIAIESVQKIDHQAPLDRDYIVKLGSCTVKATFTVANPEKLDPFGIPILVNF
jgi:hypothetical protein